MQLSNWLNRLLFRPMRGAARSRRRRKRLDAGPFLELEVARLEERRVLNAALVINAGGAVTYTGQPGTSGSSNNNSVQVSVSSNQYTFEAGPGETISVTDNSGGAIDYSVSASGRSVTVGTAGQADDVTSVDVSMGAGNDTVTVLSAEDPLTINGGGGNDTVTFKGPGSADIPGNLFVAAETIQQNGPSSLVVSGTTTLNAGASGTISLDDAGNDFQGAVDVVSAGSVTLQDSAGDFEIGTITAGGDVNLTASGSITVGDIAMAGSVELTTTAGDIKVGSITASGDVSLTASAGAITDQAGDAAVDISAASLTLTAGTGIGQGPGGSLDVEVETLSAASDTGGVALDIRDGGAPGVSVTSLDAGTSGDIAVTASSSSGGTFAFSSVSATDGNIDLSADSGNLRVDDANAAAAGSTITLTDSGPGNTIEHTAGTIQSNGGTITLVADRLQLGTPSTPATGTIASGGGDIVLRPFDVTRSIQLGGDVPPGSDVFWIGQPAANALLPGTGTIVVGDASLTGTIEVIGALDAAGKNLTLSTGNASATAISDGTPGAGGNPITGGTLSFLAVGGIDVTTAAGTIRATSSGAGAIRIDEADAVTLETVSTTDGDVAVQAGGTIRADSVQAGGTDRDVAITAASGDIDLGLVVASRTVNLTATAGAIVDNNDTRSPTNNVAAASLVAAAGTGIGVGNPLETMVGNLEAAGGAGGVFINNAGPLTVGGGGTVVRVSGTGGVQITAVGPLLVSESVVENGNGEILLQAAGSGAAGDNLTIAADVTQAGDASTARTIRLLAGDDILQSGGTIGFTNTNTGDLLAMTADSEPAPDADGDRGSITQTGGAVTAANVVLRAFESIDLTAGTNNVTNLAANVAGGPAYAFSYQGQDILNVASVDGQNGIATAGGDVSLDATGALTIGELIDVGAGTLRLVAGAGITEKASGSINAEALGARNNGASGAIMLDLANTIGAPGGNSLLAVFNNAAGQAIVVNNTAAGPLGVGTVSAAGAFDATSGIRTTAGGDVTLATAGPLDIQQPIAAAGGTVRLSAAGGVVQGGFGTITAASLGVRNSATGAGAPGNIELLLANSVAQFAALNQSAGGGISLSNSAGTNLIIGSVSATPLFAQLDGVIAGGAGAVTITTPGTLTLDQGIQSLGTAQLTAVTGSIDGTGLLAAAEGVLSAGGMIGSAAAPLSTALGILEAAATLGIYIAEADALTIGGATVGKLDGVSTTDGSIMISTGNGGITVSEDVRAGNSSGGSGDHSIVLRAGDANQDDGLAASQFVLSPGATVATVGDAPITIEADQIMIDTSGAASISAGAGVVTLQQNATAAANANASIDLGGADSFDAATSPDTVVLGLSDAELNQITAGTLRIGRPDGGAIFVSSPVDTTNVVLHLLSGGGISQAAGPGGAITASQLALTAGGPITLDNPGNQVMDLAVQTASADVHFTDAIDLNIAQVDSLTGIATSGGSVVLNGAANLASLAGADITTSAAANSGRPSGSVALTAAGAIDLAGAVITRGADSPGKAPSGGQVDINAGKTLEVTIVNSSGGNVLSAEGDGGNAADVHLQAGAAQPVTLDGSIVALGGMPAKGSQGADGTVFITTASELIDANDTLVDVDAGGLTVTATGIGDGLGIDDVLETQVARFSANVGAGGIDLQNATGLEIDGLTTAGGNISITTATGTLSVKGDVNAGDSGKGTDDVLFTALGPNSTLDISAVVKSVAGNVDLLADRNVTFGPSGRILTPAGNVTVQADAAAGNNGGSIFMADGSVIDAGSGKIALTANGDITLGGLQTNNSGASAVTIISSDGGVKDGGDTNIDVFAPAGTLTIAAKTGIGSGGSPDATADPDPDIETQVASLVLLNTTSGDIAIDEVDDVNIDSIVQLAPGFVDIDAGGTITVASPTAPGAASGILSTGGGSVILRAQGDLVFGAGTTTSVTGAGKIIGFAGTPGGNRQVVIGSGAILETSTGSIGEKITGLQILALDAATGRPVPIDDSAVSTVDTEGNTTVLITLLDPRGENFRLEINWSDGQQDNFPGFPDPVRPFSFGTAAIQPPATTLTELNAGQVITLHKRYNGNPNPDNPRARITVTGQVEFDARGRSDNGIQLFQNGAQNSQLVVVPFTFQLFVPGAGLYGTGGVFEAPTITPPQLQQQTRVQAPAPNTRLITATVARLHRDLLLQQTISSDWQELVMVTVDVQGNEGRPIPLSLDLFEGNGLLQMLRGMPNGRYRVKFRPAGGLFQTLFDLNVDQGRLLDAGREQEGAARQTGSQGGDRIPADVGGLRDSPGVATRAERAHDVAAVLADVPAEAQDQVATAAQTSAASAVPKEAMQPLEPPLESDAAGDAARDANRRVLRLPVAVPPSRAGVFGAKAAGAAGIGAAVVGVARENWASRENWGQKVDEAMESGCRTLRKSARLMRRLLR